MNPRPPAAESWRPCWPREDVRGSEESLEGPAGFYNAFTGNNRGELSYVFSGPQQVTFDPVTEGLGERWELLHTVLKMYPTAGYNCPVIDLMADIRRAHDLSIKRHRTPSPST